MLISNIRLNLDNINAKGIPSDSANAVAVNFKVPDKESGVIEAYDIVCIGAKGSNYSLRVPFSAENKEKVDILQKDLNKFEIVRIIPDPNSLKISAYAFLGEKGNLVSGVSVKAETFTVEDDDEEIVM